MARREGWRELRETLNELKGFDKDNGDLSQLACGLSYQHYAADECMCEAIRVLSNIAGCPKVGLEFVKAFDNVVKDYGNDY